MDPRQFTHPRTRLPVRLPTYPDTRQTALLSLERVTSSKIDGTSGVSISYALLADPAYPVWSNRVQSSIQYDITYSFDTTLWTTPVVPISCSTSVLPLMGMAGTKAFLYTPSKSLTLQVTAVGTTFTTTDPVTALINYLSFEPEGEVTQRQVTATMAGVASSASTASVSVNFGTKWVSITTIELRENGTTAAALVTANLLVRQIYGGTARAWFPEDYRPPIEWTSSTEPYQACRINASQLTIYNVTSTLNREGTASAVRLQASKIQPWEATSANLSDAPPSLRYVAPLDYGVEAFSLPAASAATFSDHARVVIPAVTGTLIPTLDLNLSYQYVFIDLNDPSTTTQTNLAVTYHEHREFCAASQLFNVGVSKMTVDQLVRTLQRVVTLPPARPAQTAAFGPMLMPQQPYRELTARPGRKQAPAPPNGAGGQRRRRGPRKTRGQQQPANGQNGKKKQGGLSMYLAAKAREQKGTAPRAKQPPAQRNAAR